jgi:hypothetical protein
MVGIVRTLSSTAPLPGGPVGAKIVAGAGWRSANRASFYITEGLLSLRANGRLGPCLTEIFGPMPRRQAGGRSPCFAPPGAPVWRRVGESGYMQGKRTVTEMVTETT